MPQYNTPLLNILLYVIVPSIANKEVQYSFVRPHRDRTRRCRLHQTDSQSPVKAPYSLLLEDLPNRTDSARIFRDVSVDVTTPRGALHLDTLAHEIQREHTRLRDDASEHAGSRIAGSPRQVQLAQRQARGLVDGEEDAHERHNLREARRQPAEEPPDSLVAADISYRAPQRRVDAVVALGGEARAQQVQRIRSRGGRGAGGRAADEGLGGLREAVVLAADAVQQHRRGPVGRKLHGRVRHVHQLGGDVALPQTHEALMPNDVPQRAQRALVDGGPVVAQVGVRQRV